MAVLSKLEQFLHMTQIQHRIKTGPGQNNNIIARRTRQAPRIRIGQKLRTRQRQAKTD